VVLVGTKADLMTQGQAGLKCQDIMAQIGHAEEEEKQRLRAQLHRAEITLEVTKQMLAGSSAPRKSSSMARNMLAKALRLSRKASESLQDDGLAAAAGKSIEMLEASAENLRSLLERRLKLPSEVVAVSTKTMGNYKRLKEVLAAAVADQASFARIGLKVPGYYDELQHQINSRKTTTPSMQWERFVELGLALQADLAVEEDAGMVLRAALFQHDVGEIWYKDEGALKETVFLSLP
jgi:hypothetical protein